MSERVARVTQAIAESPVSFDDALKVGFKRATEILRGTNQETLRLRSG